MPLTAESMGTPARMTVTDVTYQGLLTYGVIAMQTMLSTALTCLNKFILFERQFHFPLGLTCFHMCFLSVVTVFIVKFLKLFPTLGLSVRDYVRVR